MAGKSSREMARHLSPPIHHSTINKFKTIVLLSNAKGLKRNKFGSNVILDSVLQPDDDISDKEPARRLLDSLRAETEGVIRAKLSRQNKWIGMAEGAPVRDPNGNIIMIDGKPLLEPDHRALAAHDRNQTSDVDLLCRVRQLYQEAGESGPGLTAVMSFGDVNVYMGAQPAAGQAPQIIDAAVEPLDVGVVRAGNKR